MITGMRVALLIVLMLASSGLKSENIITFFIKPYHTTQELSQNDLAESLQKTGKMAELILERLVKIGTYQGVIASYMGYITVSDFTGRITFPRLHQEPAIKLLITPLIEPIMMLGATVHHLELINSLPAAMYSITRKEYQNYGIFYWDVQKAPLPENKRISLDTIILFAKPEALVVPVGITDTTDSSMLLLPDIYAQQELNITIEALRALKIRHFFGPVLFEHTKQNDVDYAQQLVPS